MNVGFDFGVVVVVYGGIIFLIERNGSEAVAGMKNLLVLVLLFR
jgi:hypothetical protein